MSQEKNFRYFKATAEAAQTLLDEWGTTIEPQRNALQAEMDAEFGTSFTLRHQNPLGGTRISGLGYPPKEVPEQYLGKGFTLTTQRTNRGKKLTVVKPNRRYKAGKALDERFSHYSALLSKLPGFTSWLPPRLNLEHEGLGDPAVGQTGLPLLRSHGGMAGEVLVFAIPKKSDSHKPFPEIPEFLTEIKRSEFIALTEEQD